MELLKQPTPVSEPPCEEMTYYDARSATLPAYRPTKKVSILRRLSCKPIDEFKRLARRGGQCRSKVWWLALLDSPIMRRFQTTLVTERLWG